VDCVAKESVMMKIPVVLQVGVVMSSVWFGDVKAVAQSTDVTVAIVTRAAAGPDDVAAVLPDQQVVLPLGDVVVELWAQTLDPKGLTQVSADLGFPQSAFTVTSVTHTPQFLLFVMDTIDNANGVVDDLSGAVSPAFPACSGHVGTSPERVRVAIIRMQATEAGLRTFTVGPTNNPVYVNANCGSLDPPAVTFLGASVTIGSSGGPVPASSSWGLVVLGLLLLIFGTACIPRSHAS